MSDQSKINDVTEPQEQMEMIIDENTDFSGETAPETLLEANELDNAIECLLYCSSTPLAAKHIKHFIGSDTTLGEVRKSIQRLKEKYDQPNFGLKLEIYKHGVQFRTKAAYQQFLHNYIKKRPWRISAQAMEVLSIIAYRQPIHRAAIDEIRGTDSSHLLHTLIDKELVHMASKADHLPGKPMQYCTTTRFLEVFSLPSLDELPAPKEIQKELEPGL
jgi:segregation and condensation protein B